MSTISRTLDFNAVRNILAKRKIIKLTDAGELVKVHIQSNGGTTIAVTDKNGDVVLGNNGMPLYKTIYNVAASSIVAMTNPNVRAILAEATKHESAGDMEKATELYNQYLNKTQVSFNVLVGVNTPTFPKDKLVEGTVQIITTENGSLITLDKVSAVVAKTLADSRKFSINELLGIADDPTPQDVFTPAGDEKTEGAEAAQ